MAKNQKKRAEEEAAEIEIAYESVSEPGQSKAAKKSNKGLIIAAVCIAVVAIIVGVAAGYVYFRNAEQTGLILENVTVAGVDVGGMTQSQAIHAVNAAVNYSETPMVVKVLDSQAEIPASCVSGFDVEGAVKTAYRFGNWGFRNKRQQEQEEGVRTPPLGLRQPRRREATRGHIPTPRTRKLMTWK